MAPRRNRLAQRRRFVGHTQESLAETLRVDRTTVVRWERGDCEPQPWMRRPLAAALDLSLDDLHHLLTGTGADEGTPVRVTVVAGSDDGGDVTDRRSFTVLATLAGLGVPGQLRELLTTTGTHGSVRLEQVQWARALVDRLRKTDAAVGANDLCDFSIEVYQRLSLWFRESSHNEEVGKALQGALADLANQIGWLAIDAERRTASRRYLHEAISRARMIDDPREEARAFACLSLLTRETQPRESVQCVEAAQRSAAGWATPRLRALLHLRAAHAYAHCHDSWGFGRELVRAKTWLEKGPSDDDLPFLHFVTAKEAAGLEGLSNLALGDSTRAASAFRGITDGGGESVFHRNDLYYRVRLAQAEQHRGDMAEAARVALDVLPAVVSMKSRRISALVSRLRTELEPHRAVAEVRLFTDAYAEWMP